MCLKRNAIKADGKYAYIRLIFKDFNDVRVANAGLVTDWTKIA